LSSHFFELHLHHVSRVDVDRLALSIENVNHVVYVIVEGLLREVLVSTFHLPVIDFVVFNASFLAIVDEMVMQ
jgi:hypothetical protein